MDKKKHIVKVPNVPKDFDSLIFGRQIEYCPIIAKWKENAQSCWISQKRQSYKKAISDFKRLTGAKEYYACFFPKEKGCQMWDDTFEIFYK